MTLHDPFRDLWKIVRKIPKGKVVSYGDLGKMLRNPTTGFHVGRMMASAPDGIPWWRVVAKDGSLPIHKRSPELRIEQEKRLKSEGVLFKGGRIEMERHRWEIRCCR